MTLKSIYLPLSGEADATAAADTAFSLAKTFEAHLAASDTVSEPGPFLDQTGIGMMATYYDELYKTAEKVQAHKRSAASELFEAARQRHDVPLKGPVHGAATCLLHTHDGDPAIVARLGRLANLIVLACPGERSSFADLKTLEQALFDARRPVLMVPKGVSFDMTKPALVAWNGSAEAARAVINAVPVLEKSDHVLVVQAGDIESSGTPIADAQDHLSLFGIKADIETVEAAGKSVMDVLTDRAKKISAGYVVMGAYTHNPWRELVLGGVTQHMVKHGTLPVMLAH